MKQRTPCRRSIFTGHRSFFVVVAVLAAGCSGGGKGNNADAHRGLDKKSPTPAAPLGQASERPPLSTAEACLEKTTGLLAAVQPDLETIATRIARAATPCAAAESDIRAYGARLAQKDGKKEVVP